MICFRHKKFFFGLIGPTTWKNIFSNTKGKLQSPINISSKQTVCIPSETLKPLQFSSDYYSLPQSMIACNDGRGGKLIIKIILYVMFLTHFLPF